MKSRISILLAVMMILMTLTVPQTLAVDSAAAGVQLTKHEEAYLSLLDYDNVMNQQREVIYSLRRDAIRQEDIEETIMEFLDDTLTDIYEPYEAAKGNLEVEQEEWVMNRLKEVFNISRYWHDDRLPTPEEARQCVIDSLESIRVTAPHIYGDVLRYFLLEELDRTWKEHLLSMDHLRDGIGLRGYGQRDPKQEYKREGFAMFQEMLFRIHENLFKSLTRLRLKVEEAPAPPVMAGTMPEQGPEGADPVALERGGASPFKHKDATASARLNYSAGQGGGAEKKAPERRDAPKVGRNDECPCGKGKKYKKCCGLGK